MVEKKMDCPVCGAPMKVNMDFQIAKCTNNFCEFLVNWSSPPHRVLTTLRLTLRLKGCSPLKVARIMERLCYA